MSASKTVTWECWSCKKPVSQRFFIDVDGDPAKTDPNPPEPWVTEVKEVEHEGELKTVKFYYCNDCAATRAEAEQLEDVANVTFADMDPIDALNLRQELHLCDRCTHGAVCRYAPDEEGADLLVTVSHCGQHTPDVIPEES